MTITVDDLIRVDPSLASMGDHLEIYAYFLSLNRACESDVTGDAS